MYLFLLQMFILQDGSYERKVVCAYSSNGRLSSLQDEWHSRCHSTTCHSVASFLIPS
jgi:hypothetical protein